MTVRTNLKWWGISFYATPNKIWYLSHKIAKLQILHLQFMIDTVLGLKLKSPTGHVIYLDDKPTIITYKTL